MKIALTLIAITLAASAFGQGYHYNNGYIDRNGGYHPGLGQGIAARYPHDIGIGNDPAVLLFDDFEAYTSPSQLLNKWDFAGRQSNLRIATEADHVFAGNKSLEIKLPISSSEVVNRVGKYISPEQPELHVRCYFKYDTAFYWNGGHHDGLGISSRREGGPACVHPPRDGSGWFGFLFGNNRSATSPRGGENMPGFNQVYAYWPFQRQNCGDHWFSDGWVQPGGWGLWILNPAQYPDFVAMPNWQPSRGVWYCYEFMVKVNTLGHHDGVVAFWVDGQLKGQFTNLFMRSTDAVKIARMALRLQATKNLTRVNKKWHDNVVVATSYIGPMSQ